MTDATTPTLPAERGARAWIREIAAAKKREKGYRKDGDRILDIYEGKKASTTPFNILFSNTETLLPALYSAIPVPVVSRRFKDDDPIGKAAADAGFRMLSFLRDTNVEGYETYDEAMRAATLDALLPGRGVTCVKYDADIGELPTESTDVEELGTPYKKSELVCSDTRSWNRVYFGYAKKWSQMPWIAYEEHVDRKEAERLFGAQVAGMLVYTETDEDEEKAKKENEDQGERRTACVYQIWDKDGGRKIRYVADQLKDQFLKVEEDPLELVGFFNCPRPLQFIEKSNDLTPVAPYILYENQAKELNKLQVRINRIVEAIKARGVYDSELGEDIGRIMEADDNALVPADKSASLAAEKGLQNAIWFMPIEQLVVVLRELYAARESCKNVIFEIMGLADVMRGASQASETLGAQEIKQAWGGLRLKRTQKEVQRYARDIFRIMLEIAATKFNEDTWAKMTGLPYLTEAKAAELQAVMRALQMQMQAQPPQPPQPGQPPQPNPMEQQLQQVQQALQTPKWSDVLDTLRDDMQRAYRIDIETNSTVEPEAVEDQKNIADVMNALGQFLNGVSPLVANGTMPFQAAQAMMLSIVRRFRFGDEIEEYIKAMQPPKPPEEGKEKAEQAKAQAEQQREQERHAADMQARQFEAQQREQESQRSAALQQEKADLERERLVMEREAAREEHAYRMAELRAKAALAAAVASSKLRVAEATAKAREQQAAPQ